MRADGGRTHEDAFVADGSTPAERVRRADALARVAAAMPRGLAPAFLLTAPVSVPPLVATLARQRDLDDARLRETVCVLVAFVRWAAGRGVISRPHGEALCQDIAVSLRRAIAVERPAEDPHSARERRAGIEDPAQAGRVAGAVLAACNDGRPLGKRDAASIVLILLGLQSTELEALHVDDLADDACSVHVPRLPGHHPRRARTVRVPAALQRYLAAWRAVRGMAPGPLLCALRAGAPQVPMAAVGHTQLAENARRRAAAAGFRHVGVDALRRLGALLCIQAGVSISQLRRAFGHSRARTTRALVMGSRTSGSTATLTRWISGGREIGR